MLKKERWIVYPLLMLSLFSSLVGVQVIRAQQEIMDVLTVRGIQVVNEQNTPVIQMIPDGQAGGGLIIAYDESGAAGLIIGIDSEYRGIGMFKPNGEVGIGMYTDEKGGTIEGYGKENNIALRITPSMLTYYTNYITGARMVGSELSRNGLKVEGSPSVQTHYKYDGISYTGFGGFKLPRNTTY